MPGRRDLQVVYEDEFLIVADKPYGLLTMSAGKADEPTAYSILTDYVRNNNGKYRNRGRENRIFIVHRLDRTTSGLLIFAKDPQTKYALQDNWQEVVLERIYVAVLEGVPPTESGTVSSVLRENPATHIVYSVRRPASGEGKYSVTHFKVLTAGKGYSLVQFELETGRKNQIRVHASDLGCPVAGDRRYGARTNPLGRVALHARTISFIHPATGETLRFDTGVPRQFKAMFTGGR